MQCIEFYHTGTGHNREDTLIKKSKSTLKFILSTVSYVWFICQYTVGSLNQHFSSIPSLPDPDPDPDADADPDPEVDPEPNSEPNKNFYESKILYFLPCRGTM